MRYNSLNFDKISKNDIILTYLFKIMNNQTPWAPHSPENTQASNNWYKITREKVIAAYRQFIELGISSPFDLDLEDHKVQKAQQVFDTWRSKENSLVSWDIEGEKRVNLSTTMLYVDAGFTRPAYLQDVLLWLTQDAANAGQEYGNNERTNTRVWIAKAIRKVKWLLDSSLGDTDSEI